MARNLNGWIRINRDLITSDIAKRSPETLHVWLTLLSLANYAESKTYFNGNPITIEEGQLISGISEISLITNVSEAKVKSALKYLKMTDRITENISPKGRVITITYWKEFQTDHRLNDRLMTDGSPTDDRPIADRSPDDSRTITPSEQLTINKETINPEQVNKEPVNKKEEGQKQETLFLDPPKPAAKPKRVKPEVSAETMDVRKAVRETYTKAMREKWNTEAKFNSKVNSQIASLVDRLGKDSPAVVEFFVKHPDNFYVKKCHAIGLCLQDAETLHVQWQRNQPVTNDMVRRYEKKENYRQQEKELENMFRDKS